MRKVAITIVVVLSAAVGAVVVLEAYQSHMFLDKEARSGTLWGVTIGESVETALGLLQAQDDADASKMVIYRTDSPKTTLADPLSDASIADIAGAYKFVVLAQSSGVSELTVEFEEGNVSRVHIRRRAFDF